MLRPGLRRRLLAVRGGGDRFCEGECARRDGRRERAALYGVEQREAAHVPGRELPDSSREVGPGIAGEFQKRFGVAERGIRVCGEERDAFPAGGGLRRRGEGLGGIELLVEKMVELDGGRDLAQRGFAASARRTPVDVYPGVLRGVAVAPKGQGEEFDLGRVRAQARHVLILLMHWLIRFHTAGTLHPESAAASASEILWTQ